MVVVQMRLFRRLGSMKTYQTLCKENITVFSFGLCLGGGQEDWIQSIRRQIGKNNKKFLFNSSPQLPKKKLYINGKHVLIYLEKNVHKRSCISIDLGTADNSARTYGTRLQPTSIGQCAPGSRSHTKRSAAIIKSIT